MKEKEYIENVDKLVNRKFTEIKKRLNNNDLIHLLHSAIGISTEAGEYLDMLKKHIFYGKSVDIPNIREELGDLLFYIAMSVDAIDETFEEIMNKNIEKLKSRYGDKFNEDDALNRNLTKERDILEK